MRIFTCNHCSRIHLEIDHTQIHFPTLRHLKQYLKTLDSVDAAHYAALNRQKGLTRVIILPLADNGTVHMGFTESEFEDLKDMIRRYVRHEEQASVFNIDLQDITSLILSGSKQQDGRSSFVCYRTTSTCNDNS